MVVYPPLPASIAIGWNRDAFEWRPEVGLEGALSLRFLQEPALSLSNRRVAMLPTQLFAGSAQNPLRMRLWYPPLRKNAKDGTLLCVGDASGIKSLGHPPSSGREKRGTSPQSLAYCVGATEVANPIPYEDVLAAAVVSPAITL
jgi:hypothetical protein